MARRQTCGAGEVWSFGASTSLGRWGPWRDHAKLSRRGCQIPDCQSPAPCPCPAMGHVCPWLLPHLRDTWAGGCAHVCVYAHAGWPLSPPPQVLAGTQLGCSSKSDPLGHSGMRPHLTLTQQLATQHPALGGGLGHSDSSTTANEGHRKPSGEVLGWGYSGGGSHLVELSPSLLVDKPGPPPSQATQGRNESDHPGTPSRAPSTLWTFSYRWFPPAVKLT